MLFWISSKFILFLSHFDFNLIPLQLYYVMNIYIYIYTNIFTESIICEFADSFLA